MNLFSNIKLKMLLLMAVIIFTAQAVSCQSYSRSVIMGEKLNGYESIMLIKNNKKRCNMMMSQSIADRLRKEQTELHDKLLKYFDIIPDSSVDTNIICIDSDISSILEGFTAYDANIYTKAKNSIEIDVVNSLLPKDYCVLHDESYVLFMCGSSDTTLDVLKKLHDDFIAHGKMKDGNYIAAVPDEGIYNGSYFKGIRIAKNIIEDYIIVPPAGLSRSGGTKTAKYLYDYFLKTCGTRLKMGSDLSGECEIFVGKNSKTISKDYYDVPPEITQYKIVQRENALYIMGGSEMAMQGAFDVLIKEYFEKNIAVPYDLTLEGSIEGKVLFERSDGADLRLLSNNVWENYDPVSDEWWNKGHLKGDLTDRIVSLTYMYMMYAPDVICLQELPGQAYTDKIVELMAKNNRHYEVVNIGKKNTNKFNSNFTPVLFDSDKFSLIDCGYQAFTPPRSNNRSTKSYTWVVLENIKTKQRFAAISTHLCYFTDDIAYKSNKRYYNKDSTAFRQEHFSQLGSITDEIIEKYGCTCFVMGDTNCNVLSPEFQTAVNVGLMDTHDIALQSDNQRGNFRCNASVWSYKPQSGTYKDSIDHIFVKNKKNSTILSYNIEDHGFVGTLTDHSPVYIDVKL